MSCDVSFEGMSDDADPVEFCHRSTRKARREHRCSECGETIPVGETYHATAYRFEGEFCFDRRCACCEESAAEFEYNILGGSLWDNFAEEWEQGLRVQSCLMRLTTVNAKRHMVRRWWAWKLEHETREIRRRQLLRALEWVEPDESITRYAKRRQGEEG